MAHHPKKTLEQHHLQIAVLFFGLILWFFPVPSGLDTFISSMPAGDLVLLLYLVFQQLSLPVH
jgi:hypothetical protein